MSPTVVLLGLAVTLGAFVQTSIGFGMALVAAPFVVFFAPDLMPGALLVTSMSLPILQLLGGPRDVAGRSLAAALGARVLTTPIGVALVALLSTDAVAATVGVMVLLAVAGSMTKVEVRPTVPASAAAGLVAGVSGTAASIGGPFYAIVLQHERPTRVRDNLAAFFLIGSLISTIGLLLVGQFHLRHLYAGLTWIPFLAVGYLLAKRIRDRIDQVLLRRLVLTFCTLAGLSIIARSLL